MWKNHSSIDQNYEESSCSPYQEHASENTEQQLHPLIEESTTFHVCKIQSYSFNVSAF